MKSNIRFLLAVGCFALALFCGLGSGSYLYSGLTADSGAAGIGLFLLACVNATGAALLGYRGVRFVIEAAEADLEAAKAKVK